MKKLCRCGAELAAKQRKYCSRRCSDQAEYHRNRDKRLSRNREYALRNCDKLKIKRKERISIITDEMRERESKRRAARKDYHKMYRETNKETLNKGVRLWRASLSELEVKEMERRYSQAKMRKKTEQELSLLQVLLAGST